MPDNSTPDFPAALRDTERVARLFWGVAIDDEAALWLGSRATHLREALASPRIRWQPRANWHLTVRFLGDVPVHRALAMAEALATPLAALHAFDAELGGYAWFPSQAHPRVVAADVGLCAPLRALTSVAEEAAVDCGLPAEARPWRGHVSVARVARGYRPRDPLPVSGERATLRIDHLALYESVATAEGRRYLARLRLPLAGT